MQRPISQQNLNQNSVVSNFDLDHGLIELALERSPTGGNSKSFTWSWNGNQLVVHHDLELAHHYLNRKNHTSLIALGCILTSVEIAANFQGFRIQPQSNESTLQTLINFSKDESLVSSSDDLNALMNRRTVRDPLSPSKKPNIVEMENNQPTNTIVIPNDEILDTMKNYLSKTDLYLWIQKKATLDFFKEIQFSKKPQSKTDRGIRVIDLGINKMDQMTLRIFKFIPLALSLIAKIPGLNHSLKSTSKKALQNAHLVLITAESLTPSGLIKAGQHAMRTWIKLEKQGYKVQPLSLATIPVVDALNNALPEDTTKEFKKLYTDEGPKVLSEQFGLTELEKPVWLFRVGKI